MAERRPSSDDIARAVFAASEEAGQRVPIEQSARLVGEISRLCGERPVVGLTKAAVAGRAEYVFAMVGDEAYLLRWETDALEVTFLGTLDGLIYRERTRAVGGMPNYEGDPWVAVEIEHERLPGPLRFEASDWSVSLISEMREVLRRRAAT